MSISPNYLFNLNTQVFQPVAYLLLILYRNSFLAATRAIHVVGEALVWYPVPLAELKHVDAQILRNVFELFYCHFLFDYATKLMNYLTRDKLFSLIYLMT